MRKSRIKQPTHDDDDDDSDDDDEIMEMCPYGAFVSMCAFVCHSNYNDHS